MDWDPLIEAAKGAFANAYAPYSGYRVGAAVATRGGSIYFGANVENRSFGATICAERIAIGQALSAGASELEALAVVTVSKPPASPCGMCLQVIAEFGSAELPILLVSLDGAREQYRLSDFHPHPFELPEQGLGRRPKG
ncbi:MAG: cytidine deaminase [Acidobacteriota bacterium]